MFLWVVLPINDLTLLVGQQEGHSAWKTYSTSFKGLRFGLIWSNDGKLSQ